MYKDETPKSEDYQNAISIEESIALELDTFLKGDQQEDLFIGVSGKNINATIKDTVIKMGQDNPMFNTNYLNEEVELAERKYAIKAMNNMLGVKGVWINYEGDTMILRGSADIHLASFITYKTSIKITLTITEENEIINLTVKNIHLGNLSGNWIYNLSKTALKSFMKLDIGEFINEKLPMGTFDAETRTMSITKSELYGLMDDLGGEDLTMNALLELIKTLNLLSFEVKDSAIGLGVDLEKIKATLELNENITQLDSQEAVLQVIKGQLTSLLISTLTSDTTDTVNLDIYEKQFNEILNYYLNQETLLEKEIPLGGKTFKITMMPILSKLVVGEMKLSLRIKLANQTDDNFITEIVINIDPQVSETSPSDLVFEITSLDIGTVKITTESELWQNLQEILSEMLTSDDISMDGNKIILKDFMDEFVKTGTTVEDVLVLEGKLRFKLKPANQTILNEVKEEIKNVLDEITADLENNIDIDTDADPEVILDYVNDLTEEEKETLYNDIADKLGDLDIDLSELLANLGQTTP